MKTIELTFDELANIKRLMESRRPSHRYEHWRVAVHHMPQLVFSEDVGADAYVHHAVIELISDYDKQTGELKWSCEASVNDNGNFVFDVQ